MTGSKNHDHYGFEMGNLKYYGILTHMYCFIVYHVKISHFFRAKNEPLEENPMSPESEPRLMWLPIANIFLCRGRMKTPTI